MTNYLPDSGRDVPLESKWQILEYFADSFKEKSNWRVGIESESILIAPGGGPFFRSFRDVRLFFSSMKEFGWEPIRCGSVVTGLCRDESYVSLEPGKQLELASAPHRTCHGVARDVDLFLKDLELLRARTPFFMLYSGFNPEHSLRDVRVDPLKPRYELMERYAREQGDAAGLDMMFRTASTQVSLDFSSEEDVIRKWRVSMALQPVVSAMLASSPFREGKNTGFLSYRGDVWNRLDARRSGMLPFIFEPGFGLERYVDHVLDAPMYFIDRDNKCISVGSMTFREFMRGRVCQPTLHDFSLHLTTVFPDVRLKKVLEMRGSDSAGSIYVVALSALWVGLLYDEFALTEVAGLVKEWAVPAIEKLRAEVPKLGMRASIRGQSVLDLLRRVLRCAADGLSRRGYGEEVYLGPLTEIVERGTSPAQLLLDRFRKGGGIMDAFVQAGCLWGDLGS